MCKECQNDKCDSHKLHYQLIYKLNNKKYKKKNKQKLLLFKLKKNKIR